MELVDLYDENRKPLGKIHPRKEPLQPGEFLVAVGIWVFNDRQEILLTKRSPNKKFAPNLWENTGGHVVAGETSKAAIARELFEETGIRAAEEDLYLFATTKVPPFFGDNYILYRNVSLSEIVLQPEETCDVQWVSLDRFNKMIETGELAPSVAAHLSSYRTEWEKALTQPRKR